MLDLLFFANILSIVAFFTYGVMCISTSKLHDEFKRYGLSDFRFSIALLEIVGAAGLALGFYYPLLTIASSLGLTVLMVGAVMVRIKIKDSLLQSAPALLLLAVNAYILVVTWIQ